MLTQYTWGDFALFILVVVVLYYVVVGLLYYRQELGALLTRKGRGGAQFAGVGGRPASASPPALVRTTSAFVTATPTATESRAPAEASEPEAGAAQNLPEGQAVTEVTGSLPDSTAAATGLDDAPAAAPMAAAGGAETETASAVEYDEQRTEELDEIDVELASRARELGAEMPSEETDETAPDHLFATSHEEADDTETSPAFAYVESETAYEQEAGEGGDLLFSFQEPIGSPADVLTMAGEPLVAVTSVVDFIAQAQAGKRPAVPAQLKETALASLVADRVTESNQELSDFFGADD